jgi:hypothetical protein
MTTFHLNRQSIGKVGHVSTLGLREQNFDDQGRAIFRHSLLVHRLLGGMSGAGRPAYLAHIPRDSPGAR